MIRVAHLVAEFSAYEAMGRTIVETATRVDAEHHLVATRAHDSTTAFAGVHEVGGGPGVFPLRHAARLAAVLDRVRPDLVHLHAGALGPLQAALPVLRHRRAVLTVYAWPRLPGPGTWRRARLTEMWSSNVLRPRVVATTVLPAALGRAVLARSGVGTVLTPDPRVARRLAGAGGVAVSRLMSGPSADARRARFDPEHPVIVFAGRAETVRGLDTLLAAFPLVRGSLPAARLRLLLIPRPELPAILARAADAAGRAADAADRAAAVDVVTEPVPDLLAEFAAAQVGVWPFKFDYTTSPPAMAVAEAMSVGLPVVATDVACVRAVLEPGVNGVAVPPADPAALAAALVGLLRDRAAWSRYAAAAARSIDERFGWERVAEATARTYAAVTAA